MTRAACQGDVAGPSDGGVFFSRDAIRLIAAAKAEWERIGANPEMRFWTAFLDRYTALARNSLGESAAAKEWDEGSRIPFERASELALG